MIHVKTQWVLCYLHGCRPYSTGKRRVCVSASGQASLLAPLPPWSLGIQQPFPLQARLWWIHDHLCLLCCLPCPGPFSGCCCLTPIVSWAPVACIPLPVLSPPASCPEVLGQLDSLWFSLSSSWAMLRPRWGNASLPAVTPVTKASQFREPLWGRMSYFHPHHPSLLL